MAKKGLIAPRYRLKVKQRLVGLIPTYPERRKSCLPAASCNTGRTRISLRRCASEERADGDHCSNFRPPGAAISWSCPGLVEGELLSRSSQH
jgi:hypothetical protein